MGVVGAPIVAAGALGGGAAALADAEALADAAGAGVSAAALADGAALATTKMGVATALIVGVLVDVAAFVALSFSGVMFSLGLESLLLHAATATRAAPCVRRMSRSSRCRTMVEQATGMRGSASREFQRCAREIRIEHT